MWRLDNPSSAATPRSCLHLASTTLCKAGDCSLIFTFLCCASPTALSAVRRSLTCVSLRTRTGGCRGSKFLYGDLKKRTIPREWVFHSHQQKKKLCAWRDEIFAGAKRLKTPCACLLWGAGRGFIVGFGAVLESLDTERFTPFHHFIRPLQQVFAVPHASKLHDATVTHLVIQANDTKVNHTCQLATV